MEKWKGLGRYLTCIILLGGIFCLFGVRLVDWQIISGEELLEESTNTNTSVVKMEAARGEILDRNGAGLAVNRTGYSIRFDRAYMTADTQNQTILRLVHLLDERGEEWIDVLPIEATPAGTYEFIEGMEDEAADLKESDPVNVNPYATADECMKALIEYYECDGYDAQDTRDIVSVRYNMTMNAFSVSNPYTFAPDVSTDTVGIISENKQLLPGATIQVTTQREYPNGTIAPHIVGTMGAITQEEYNEFKSQGQTYSLNNISGYGYNDWLGKSGIESAFESTLRGENGRRVIETTRTGSVASETITENPTPGNTIYLSIDSRIQAVAQASLEHAVLAAQEYGASNDGNGSDCAVGAAIVMDAKDFTILAAANYPNYDLKKYSEDPDYRRSLLTSTDSQPLYNNAFLGNFMPGSAYKPMVACAALQEGVLSSSTRITCNHVYTRWDDYRPQCMGWHGTIGLTTALQKSCNIFFYETGYQLGIDAMESYARSFGFGGRTGVEVSEGTGLLATPEEREERGGEWVGGDVVQAAIGQSDNAVTPIQLATYVATICNGGQRLRTSVVDKITDYSRETVISEHQNEVVADTGVSQENLDLVKQGMRAVCQTGGTASLFNNYPIAVAGKTGTAEVPPHSDNVTFVGFAPYDDPEIVIAVVLQYGARSQFSNGVAQDLFNAYFFGYTVDTEGNVVPPPQEDASDSSADSAGSADSADSADTSEPAAASAEAASASSDSTDSTDSTNSADSTGSVGASSGAAQG